jgi:hypothetical protein
MTATSNGTELIYAKGDINITKYIASISGVSYPINNIGSVRVVAPKRVGEIIGAIILALIGIGVLADKTKPDGNTAWWFIAGAAFFIFKAITKPHVLMVHTASLDKPALESTNKAVLFAVKEAIEKAVSSHA